ncbi:MAG: putative selenium-dependent hydroxylase accessory protein YqeC, partial [Chloroflexi bacterium]|nr:putative selenium-dependent hydroxylase accessory protein YqeC [Chloroflexota bacterium]
MQLTRALRLRPREIVAFVGGGGKTTAMFRMAAEIVASGRRVITTTTTRIFAAQTRLAPAHIVVDEAMAASWAELRAALDSYGHALVTGRVDSGIGKAFGVEPRLISQLADLPDVSAVLVEADGSRMRPLKAPAEHEPVIPGGTTLVVAVAGADVIGKRLDDVHVHRSGLLGQILSLSPGAVVTPDVVASAIVHPLGGRKAVPAGARFVALVNKTEGADRLGDAREIAR